MDLSKLIGWPHELQITFDAAHLFDAELRQYFQFSDADITEYNPGRTLRVGFRGRL